MTIWALVLLLVKMLCVALMIWCNICLVLCVAIMTWSIVNLLVQAFSHWNTSPV